MNDDGTISVRNFQTLGAPNGLPVILNGEGNIPDSNKPGELVIKYEGIVTNFDYEVLALGPEVDGLYEWSIVTNSDQQYLFVFARDYNTFKEKYDGEVLAKCKDLNYILFYSPLTVHQGSDCKYEGTR